MRKRKYSEKINVLIDTGSFNTVVDQDLAAVYGIIYKKTMSVKMGGYSVDAPICLIHKMTVNDFTMEKVLVLAMPFKGELRRHILLGTNVLNNWDFQISRKRNELRFNEDFPIHLQDREFPYKNYFDNKGKNLYFQEGNTQEGNI